MKLPPVPSYSYSRPPPPPPYSFSNTSNAASHLPLHHYSAPNFQNPSSLRPAHHSHHAPSSSPKQAFSINLHIVLIGLIFVLSCLVIALSLPSNGSSSSLEFYDEPASVEYQQRRTLSTASSRRSLSASECNAQLVVEKRVKDDLLAQIKMLEADLADVRLKNRELESDYRELSLSARAAAPPLPASGSANKAQEDVSALQRLSKCRSSLEESSVLLKELRDGNKQVNSQVTRLQKELREAIADADEQENVAKECLKKLK